MQGKVSLCRVKSGFTLVEVLVAVLVIAFGCLAAAKLQVSVFKAKTISDRLSAANFLAESELETLKSLTFPELNLKTDYEETNLTGTGLVCRTPNCSGGFFTRRVKFYRGQPTAFSCHVEIEVAWQDSTGPHQVLYSSVLTGKSY
ncbi:MAG: prepilin-type N-terminal cleavage/methylation domain-containing protein [Deltaproteobacteria bacterium]|jgi:prepilin-type N-terminal cleavage/methylation domain-containing protein|nr:prepilin-type N-terminal cleavage/methylation domain-containing protein [Deltaproteobacteria bacterium]